MSTNFNEVTSGSPLTAAMWNDNFDSIALQNISQAGVGIVSGCVLSAGSGLTLNISAGVVVGHECVPISSFTWTCLDNVTRYAWLDWTVAYISGVTTYIPTIVFTTSTTNPGGTIIPLGKVITASGAITSITTDNRSELARWISQLVYEIGQGRLTVDDGLGVVTIPSLALGSVQGNANPVKRTSATQAIPDANTTPAVGIYSCSRIILTGALTANRDLVLPLVADAWWTIVNNCTGSFSINCIGATGAGILIANGKSASIWSDGTNIYRDTLDSTITT